MLLMKALTDHASADVLPVFSPDGRHLLWTTGRSSDLSSQLWLAELHLDAIDAALDELPGTPQTATP